MKDGRVDSVCRRTKPNAEGHMFAFPLGGREAHLLPSAYTVTLSLPLTNSRMRLHSAGSVVVCVDEFGPLECRPYNGRTWAECKKPVRLPATYRRTQGVQHFLAMYDVHHNFLWGWFYKRKRGEEFIEFLKRVRGAYASWVRIYVVMDNFSPHIRQDVKKYAAKSRMELVYIATNASWMNRIEAHFRPLRKFALEGSYPKTHEELEKQIMDYLEWRNANPNDPEILEEQKKCRVA